MQYINIYFYLYEKIKLKPEGTRYYNIIRLCIGRKRESTSNGLNGYI